MDQIEKLRTTVLHFFVREHRSPSVRELSQLNGSSEPEVRAGLASLAEQHAMAVHPRTGEIRMAHPFSAVPSHFRVDTSDGSWWPNCAWCGLGILAMLGKSGTVLSACATCERAFTWTVVDGKIEPAEEVVHVALPAWQWWIDVTKTCGTILGFCSESEVDEWCAARKRERGSVLSPDQLWHLSQLWYGDRLQPTWRKTPERAAQIFKTVGLDPRFWTLVPPEQRVG